ncbi:MAG: hypothetical protein J0L76_07700 [Rhodobacterales bacterium]|nr:hypothetical protein [Rhodobacterales bacterium]
MGLLAEWLGDTFVVPAGPSRGEPLTLLPFQLAFLRDHLADDPDGGPRYRTTVLSTPRKNGKTATVGALILGYMCPGSPLFIPGFRGAVTAPSVVHAQIVGNQVIDILEASGVNPGISFVRSPLPGVLHGPRGGKLQFLSGTRNSGHGLDIDLGIVDETGLLPNSNESLQNVFDAVGARNGRVILTGTQGDNPHFRAILERPDARTAVHLYAADLSDDVSDPGVWAASNPGLGSIKSVSFMRDAFEKAEKSGSLTEFRVWQTNQPLSPSRQLLIEYGTLQRAYDPTAQPIPDEPCFVGLDLGGSAAMTAAVIVYKESCVIRALAAFPGEGDLDLAQRGKRDGVGNLYVSLAESGELFETSGAITDIAEFLSRLRDEIGTHPVASISGDRYRHAEFLMAMARAKVDWPLITRGTGPKDGDNDIRATRRLFLSGKAKLKRSLLIEAAIAETDVKVSTTGAMQIDRSHRNARIDVAQALCLACSAFVSAMDAPKPEYEVALW